MMVTTDAAYSLAQSFPETEIMDHFGKPSFRVRKKIFAALSMEKKTLTVKLNLVDQSVFCDYDASTFAPATGAWGRQGWTIIQLKRVRKSMLKDAITLSWREVAPKRLVASRPDVN